MYRTAETEQPSDSDEELMRRVCGGDTAAMGCLVKRYEGPLFGFLRRLLGNAAEAEDVFQETFLRVFTHRRTFRSGSPFRPWLYRIATNLCRDRLRYWRRRPIVTLESTTSGASVIEHVANGKPGPVERAKERELEERLQEGLAALPVKQRTVFLMARYEGMSYEEIASALQIPEGTVKSRMSNAVHFLMDRLREFLP